MTAVHRHHQDEDGRSVNPRDNPTFASVLTRRAVLKGAAAGLVLVTASGLRRLPEATAQSMNGLRLGGQLE